MISFDHVITIDWMTKSCTSFLDQRTQSNVICQGGFSRALRRLFAGIDLRSHWLIWNSVSASSLVCTSVESMGKWKWAVFLVNLSSHYHIYTVKHLLTRRVERLLWKSGRDHCPWMWNCWLLVSVRGSKRRLLKLSNSLEPEKPFVKN